MKQRGHEEPLDSIRHKLTLPSKIFSHVEINSLLGTLLDKKRQLESAEKEMEFEILTDFLTRMKTEKELARARLERELVCLNEDLATAQMAMARLTQRKLSEERRLGERSQSGDVEAETERGRERLLENGVPVPDDDEEESDGGRKRKYEVSFLVRRSFSAEHCMFKTGFTFFIFVFRLCLNFSLNRSSKPTRLPKWQ